MREGAILAMDMARRRTGKGIGATLENTGDLLELEDRSVAGGEGDAGDSARQAEQTPQRTLESESGGHGERVVQSTSVATISPFWSSRAQDEARLRAARPDFLGSAEEELGAVQRSRASSSSTELRLAENVATGMSRPQGEPISYGPGSRLQTTLDGDVPTRTRTTPDSPVEAPAPAGLSAKEREVLSAMRDAMVRLADQNSELLSQNEMLRDRVSRLEDERSTSQAAWQSAESNHDIVEQQAFHTGDPQSYERKGDGFNSEGIVNRDAETLASMQYEQGYQQGYLAAKEILHSGVTGGYSERVATDSADNIPASTAPSFGVVGSRDRERTPPPNPNRAWNLHCNTTPQGTPVPREPPPPDVSVGGQGTIGGMPSIPGFPLTASVGIPSTGVDHSINMGLHTQGSQGFKNDGYGSHLHMSLMPHPANVPTTPVYGPPGNADPGRDPWMGGVPMQIEGGRDPYAPGDRVYWTLPVLDDPSAPEAATRAADWLELVRPLMADLSQGSASWWQRVEWEARSLYAKWTAMSAINRGLLIPTMSSQLADIRFQRLESRAFSMLQAALPKAVKDELLATRTLTTVSAIFVTLKLYAPGGLAERNELLDSLTSLGVAKTAQDAVAQIRRWHRCLARAQGMGVAVPDPARLIKALDGLSEGLLRKHTQVAFRLSQARTYLQLDHVPSMSALQEFARIMQSEWEMIAVSGANENNKTKLSKLDAEEGKSWIRGKKGEKEKGIRTLRLNPTRRMKKEERVMRKLRPKVRAKLVGFTLPLLGAPRGGNAHSSIVREGKGRVEVLQLWFH